MTGSDVIVTAHQLNFLPGRSVMERVRRADIVIWLDTTQYVRHGFVNRNRLSDGAWMTVPVNEHDTYAPINRVRISDENGRKREKIARTLEMRLGPVAAPFAAELRKPYQLLVGLNHGLMQHLLGRMGARVEQTFQSFLDTQHAVPAVSEDEEELVPVKERFADMAAQLGATVWLSGPGRHFGDERRFQERGIRIETFRWEGPNPCALEAAAGLEVAA